MSNDFYYYGRIILGFAKLILGIATIIVLFHIDRYLDNQ